MGAIKRISITVFGTATTLYVNGTQLITAEQVHSPHFELFCKSKFGKILKPNIAESCMIKIYLSFLKRQMRSRINALITKRPAIINEGIRISYIPSA